MATPDTTAPQEHVFVVYAMPGSQYTAKVLAALDARNIPHFVQFVNSNPTRRNLPSGGTMVPELQVFAHKESIAIVPDSEDILHWFDDNYNDPNKKFFGDKATSTISMRASNGILAGAVLYYNWVNQEGYEKSMRLSLGRLLLPSWVFVFRNETIDYFIQDTRASFRIKAAKHLNLDPQNEEFANETHVYQMLMAELKHFQSLLVESHKYMQSRDEPTAADFSIYAQLERLVGDMGDVNVPCSLPKLLEEQELERLWKWHQMMRKEHPIKFKGKRRVL